MDQKYKISELAQKANVSKRTIHYYVGRGLIPPPQGAGVGSLYREEHLVKILIIKRLQEYYLPLDRIGDMVRNLSPVEARNILKSDEDFKRLLAQVGEYGSGDTTGLSHELSGSSAEEASTKKTSIEPNHYVRIPLGMGMELHCPVTLLNANADLVSNIEKYSRKLINER